MENTAHKTAWGPMVQVALEQYVPVEQRLVDDPFAYRFLPTYLKGMIALLRIDGLRRGLLNLVDQKAPGIRGGLLCRKRYIDDKLAAALEAGIQTVVILGAGFDTRACRLTELASRQVFEVDLPQVIQAKKVVLERLYGGTPAHVKLVAMDFDRQDTAQVLAEAGYPVDQPAFFIWEGVTQYITETAVRRTFEFLRGASPGSQLVMTYIRQDFIEGEQMYGQELLYSQTRVKKQFWVFGMEPGSVGAFLNPYGWVELEQAGTSEYRARYLEPLHRDLPVMEVERAVHALRAA